MYDFDLAARINRLFRKHGFPDGLPIPPASLIRLVSSTTDLTWFYESGRRSAESIQRILHDHGVDLARFRTILDFGCGCGRTIRHFRSLRGPTLYGTDYNPRLIAWCTENLPFARFSLNQLAPPLPGRIRFDFIYALSVFTHLPPPLASGWMRDLRRHLGPGGYLLVTTHGAGWRARFPSGRRLTARDRRELEASGTVTKQANRAGRNTCMTFHSLDYVARTLAAGFEVIGSVPAGIDAYHQDATLLRRQE